MVAHRFEARLRQSQIWIVHRMKRAENMPLVSIFWLKVRVWGMCHYRPLVSFF